MATKWVGTIPCHWCGGEARAGIEKEGQGQTYRLICSSCGLMSQVAFHYPAVQEIARLLNGGAKQEPSLDMDRLRRLLGLDSQARAGGR